MRIFYIITKSEAGGAQTHVFQLSSYMRSLGNEVAVMSYPGGWLEGEIKKIGAKFYPNFYLSNSLNPIGDICAAYILKKAIEDFKPDIVSAHSTKAGIIARFVVRNKIPTLFTAHGWGFTPGVRILQKYATIVAEKIAAIWCSKIICVSEFDRQLAIKFRITNPQKLITIHNVVEIRNSIERNFSKTPIKIIFVGRLAKPKDPILLLEAFAILDSNLRNLATIDIIGGGPRKKEIEKKILQLGLQDKVTLHGDLHRERVFKMLAESDIFVLTTNYEGFPRSILEAMSMGLPVIATDVGGVKEAVSPECGILIPRADKAELVKALKKLIEDPEKRKAMGYACYQRAKSEFSLEKMLEATRKVYEEVFRVSNLNQIQ